MKHITLKRGANIQIKTPNGLITVGVSDPYNAPPHTYLYFSDGKHAHTRTVDLDQLRADYPPKDDKQYKHPGKV